MYDESDTAVNIGHYTNIWMSTCITAGQQNLTPWTDKTTKAPECSTIMHKQYYFKHSGTKSYKTENVALVSKQRKKKGTF